MRAYIKKLGRRLAQTYGRTHGPSKGNTKRVANKGVRTHAKVMLDLELDLICSIWEQP